MLLLDELRHALELSKVALIDLAQLFTSHVELLTTLRRIRFQLEIQSLFRQTIDNSKMNPFDRCPYIPIFLYLLDWDCRQLVTNRRMNILTRLKQLCQQYIFRHLSKNADFQLRMVRT